MADDTNAPRKRCFHDVSYRKQVFNSNYASIMERIKSGGDPRLNSNCPEQRRLSNWMRRQFKRTDVTEDERAKLDELQKYYGNKSRTSKEDESWQKFFQLMEKYKEEYHTLVISRKDTTNRSLYHWAARQRRRAKENTLPPERRQQLADIGFHFNDEH